jgi:hypothetical protein
MTVLYSSTYSLLSSRQVNRRAREREKEGNRQRKEIHAWMAFVLKLLDFFSTKAMRAKKKRKEREGGKFETTAYKYGYEYIDMHTYIWMVDELWPLTIGQ